MSNIEWILIIITIFLVILLFRYIQLKKQIRNLADQVNELNSGNSQQMLDISLIDKDLERLAGILNQYNIRQRQAVAGVLRNEEYLKESVANISHDLRTPLTSIYGSSSTLISKKDALSEEQQLKLLGEIQEDSEWLIRMVENLLAVTRIDGAKVKVVKTPIVLDELIDSVLMKFSKKHPNQKVITQIPADFVDIPMDSILIEQVLLNFLENAVFHANGMTELKLSVSLAGDKAIFEVADNGCGIPEEILDKIFTGCYKKSAAPIDGTRSNMGIGISVCAAIIKAHGSEIFVENRKGGGAVFRFSLARGCDDEQ